jgi:hypothetical protein
VTGDYPSDIRKSTDTDGGSSVANEPIETDTTRATARLPGLEIEIVHRRPSDRVEQISINLQATPSFDAFGQYFAAANPFVFWSRLAEAAWLPWSDLARAMMTPWAAAPLPRVPAPGVADAADTDNA